MFARLALTFAHAAFRPAAQLRKTTFQESAFIARADILTGSCGDDMSGAESGLQLLAWQLDNPGASLQITGQSRLNNGSNAKTISQPKIAQFAACLPGSATKQLIAGTGALIADGVARP